MLTQTSKSRKLETNNHLFTRKDIFLLLFPNPCKITFFGSPKLLVLQPKAIQMKKYHVYGLGNALVDLDFEIAHETLNRLKIEKGVMTLIDTERHVELLQDLDGYKHVKACGGSAANTIMATTQLGGKSFYSCKVGNDTFGDFFYEELLRNDIGTNLDAHNRQHGSTGACLVLVTPDADRTMNTHLGISETLAETELDEASLVNSEYLYVEGYLSTSPTGSEAAITAMNIAKASGTKTALSLSDPNIVRYFHARLLEIIGDGVDLLFCNEDEAKLFCQTDDLALVCEKLQTVARSFAITQGPQGSIIYDGTQLYDIGAREVKVIDTVGAGDMFAGGFIYALTHGYDYKTAGIIGDIIASKVITKFGPRLNTHEILEVKKDIELLNEIMEI